MMRAVWLVLHKDLLIEWRSKARLNALLFFSLATLLLFSFAMGPDTKLMGKHGGAYLWLAALFASVLSLGESFAIERENRALDGLRLLGLPPAAIFLGKAIASTLLSMGLVLALVPVMVALYDVHIYESLWWFPLLAFLGALALSILGTLFSAMASLTRARDVLLPLLLFPLLVPALLSLTRSTQLVIVGDPMRHLDAWVGLLVCFDVVYCALGFLLFAWVMEE